MGAAGGSTVLQCEPAFCNSAVGCFFSGGLFQNILYALADVLPPLTSESPWEGLTRWEWRRSVCRGMSPAAELGVRHSKMPSLGTDLEETTPDQMPTALKVKKTLIHPRNCLLFPVEQWK